MIATTYTRSVIVLLCLAGLPTLRQVTVGAELDDGLRAVAVPMRLAGVDGAPTTRQPSWVERRFASTDFIERTYGTTRLFVVRSFDFTSLYHHPELAVTYRTGAVYDGVKVLGEGQSRVPVHFVRPSSGARGFGGYVLLYGRQRLVERPYWFHVALTGELLLRRRAPMTLFFVYDDSAPPDATAEDAACIPLLLEAVRAFQAHTDGELVAPSAPPSVTTAGSSRAM